MMYKKFLIFICALCVVILHAKVDAATIALHPEYSQLPPAQGETIYLPVTLSIPENGYIYANPKGPGTGKPLSIKISTVPNVKTEKIRIVQPEKYFPDQEGTWVWRYRKTIRFYIPLVMPRKTVLQKITYTISLNALFCSASSCTPLTKEQQYTLFITPESTVAKHLVTKRPQDTIALGDAPTIASKNVSSGEALLDRYTFYPRYISETKITSILQAILFSLLAGMLLNIMPCVLPVISLKIMSFIQHAHQNRKKLLLAGFSYTTGVLLSFLLLASLIVFAGQSWGSLFQNETFILIMIVIIFAFSLSLFGLFSIGIPTFAAQASTIQYASPYIDAFMKGLLATLLATPCSGPFLGATLAWTVAQPPLIIYIVFSSMALGMSLPYLVLSSNPRLIAFIPKPGEWTIFFEKLMGFLLLGTVVYLLTLLSQGKQNPASWMLLLLAFGLWIYGRQQQRLFTRKKRFASLIVLVLFCIAAYSIPFHLYTRFNQHRLEAKPFSFEQVLQNSKNGIVTIVEFTADWCPNCRLVEAQTLHTKEFADLLKQYKCAFLKADITQPETEGEKLLHKLGSQSIPFLALFPAGEAVTKPFCVRDIYTIDDIKKGLESSQQTIVPDIDLERVQFEMPPK